MTPGTRVLICLAVFTLASAGCAPTPEEHAAGQVFDDGLTTVRVKRALLHQDGVRLSDIDISTDNGVVRLSGFVGSDQAARAAEQATRAVAGVKAVQNELRVRP